jgi:DNA-directed RNA polymerase specialized sigma24 family protein
MPLNRTWRPRLVPVTTNRDVTLAELDPLHREVILVRDIEEWSAPEAAAQLGISIDALKSRLHRARVNLRDRVRQRAVRL